MLLIQLNNNELRNDLKRKDETKKNLDLWVKIIQLLEHHDVTIEWTKGHSVNKWNNLADLYAQHASQIINPIEDECEHCTKKLGNHWYPAIKS